MTDAVRSAAPADEETRLVARLRDGIRHADSGRPAEAESVFRGVLAATRGSGTNAERFACSCLVKLFARRHRDVEALVMARRHVVLARARGDVEATCVAYSGLGDAFARIENWERLDATAGEFERALDSYDGVLAVPLRRCLHRLRAELALARDDEAAARAEIERLAAVDPDAPEGPDEARATMLFEADLALRRGRAEEARATLERIAEGGAPAGSDALDAGHLAVRCTLAIDGPVAATDAASRLLDVLESADAALFGAGACIRCARRLGDLAAAECGAPSVAKRAYDVAAAAVLVRAAEIERVTQDLPELGAVDADDAAALAEYRSRFVADQRELIAAVGRLLRARVAADEIPNWARETRAGAVAVCAWCLHVRLEDGATLPLGHFLPSDGALRVSHGICPRCVRGMATARDRGAGAPPSECATPAGA